jgi:DNA-binding HxlR family transcriptional regulator
MDTDLERAPGQGDLFDPACPTRHALDRIGDKWTVMIVETLARDPRGGTLRFTELRARVRDITPKVLTQALRSLERDGLLDRRVFAEVPPRVEYALTPLGVSLREPLAAVRRWAETHIATIVGAQERYDARIRDGGGPD